MSAQFTYAFLIHSRKYTDTRVIVEFFTREFGRVAGVYRLKGRKNTNNVIPSFTPLLISWKGEGELKTITHCESASAGYSLSSRRLFSGMYLNELLMRLLPKEDSAPESFGVYEQSLVRLALLDTNEAKLETLLRIFELSLLGELGYAISFRVDTNGELIEASEGRHYRMMVEQGFQPVGHSSASSNIFSGLDIRSIEKHDFDNESTLRTAKIICRSLLKLRLGDKPLKSRELFK